MKPDSSLKLASMAGSGKSGAILKTGDMWNKKKSVPVVKYELLLPSLSIFIMLVTGALSLCYSLVLRNFRSPECPSIGQFAYLDFLLFRFNLWEVWTRGRLL